MRGRLAIPLLLTLILAMALPAAAQSRPATQQAPTTTGSRPTSGASTRRATAMLAPVTFGRSGKKVKADLRLAGWSTFTEDRPDGQPVTHWVEHVSLHAFGRVWGDETPVKANDWRGPWSGIEAEIQVPSVRVPTVFSIRPVWPTGPGQEIGILIAYPDKDVEWEKKITLYSCGAPAWFDQWSAATGLPVKQVALADLASAKLAPADEKGKSLLILGRESAGKDLSGPAKLADEKKVNVLVLEADWFGDSSGEVVVEPKHMFRGLAEIAKQKWPEPLKFPSHRQPWPGIANRWALIAGDDGLPLTEELAVDWERDAANVVASYLSWQSRLGRDESADALLLAMLRAATTTQAPARALADVLYPPPKEMDATSRPVLKRTDVGPRDISEWPGKIRIIDLRGATPPADSLLGQLKKKQAEMEGEALVYELRPPVLLILGDDKLLDDWEWLKLDRAKKALRPGVVWLSDDELPPSKDNQVRLMLKLTELGVPLATPEKRENGK